MIILSSKNMQHRQGHIDMPARVETRVGAFTAYTHHGRTILRFNHEKKITVSDRIRDTRKMAV